MITFTANYISYHILWISKLKTCTIKNSNSATPDNFRQGRIDFNRTGRLSKKQQTIDEFQRQMISYGDND